MASRREQLEYELLLGKKVFVDVKWSGRTQVGILSRETRNKIFLFTNSTYSEIAKDSIARLTTENGQSKNRRNS